MDNEIYKYIIIAIISFIMAMCIALAPASTVIIKGTEENKLFLEYKGKVYHLTEPPYNKTIHRTKTVGDF